MGSDVAIPKDELLFLDHTFVYVSPLDGLFADEY